MFHQFIRTLLIGVILLAVGCNHSLARFTEEISRLCPAGWQVSASNNVITLRREAAVWVMGNVSNPPSDPGESMGHYFQRVGHKIPYEVRLEFVPLLPQSEYKRLKAAHEQAAARFNKGASGKREYDRWSNAVLRISRSDLLHQGL